MCARPASPLNCAGILHLSTQVCGPAGLYIAFVHSGILHLPTRVYALSLRVYCICPLGYIAFVPSTVRVYCICPLRCVGIASYQSLSSIKVLALAHDCFVLAHPSGVSRGVVLSYLCACGGALLINAVRAMWTSSLVVLFGGRPVSAALLGAARRWRSLERSFHDGFARGACLLRFPARVSPLCLAG
jgi:hypothetical protein